MINKKDLRKGNIVLYNGVMSIVDSVSTVVGVWESLDGYPMVDEIGLPHFASNEELFPVKLTSEILKSSGFIKNDYSIKGVIFWQSPDFRNTKVELMEVEGGFNFLDYVVFNEVHTFQNFYNSITGTDLIINYYS